MRTQSTGTGTIYIAPCAHQTSTTSHDHNARRACGSDRRKRRPLSCSASSALGCMLCIVFMHSAPQQQHCAYGGGSAIVVSRFSRSMPQQHDTHARMATALNALAAVARRCIAASTAALKQTQTLKQTALSYRCCRCGGWWVGGCGNALWPIAELCMLIAIVTK